MSKTNLDALCASLGKMQEDKLKLAKEVMDCDVAFDICLKESTALRDAIDELKRMDMQIAAMRYDLKNVGCENCAHWDCGNTEEPCKSCGIRELKWEWEGSGNGGAEDGNRSDSV